MKIIKLILLIFAINLNANLLPIDKNLINEELPNGFKYTIVKNDKPKDAASLRLVVKVGSLEEDEDQKGVAHLVEHLAFNGTQNFQGNSMVKFLQALGIEFGAHLNANTGTNRTLYKIDIALKDDNLEKSMLIFGDWARRVLFTDVELEKERGVVLEEARVSHDIDFRIYLQQKDIIFANSRYKDRTPIGDLNIIKNIKLDRVKAFYDDWYRPEFMHFIIVGDVNITKTRNLIKDTFGGFKNQSTRKRASRSIPYVNDTRILIVKDKELTTSNLSIKYIENYTKMLNEKDYKNMIIRNIVLKLFNKKASEQIIKKNPAANSIMMSSSKLGDNLRVYSFDAFYSNLQELNALKELVSLIYSIEKYGFKKSEFQRSIKEMLKNNKNLAKTIKNKTNNTLAHAISSHVIQDSIYIDEEYSLNLQNKFLNSITLQDVNKAFNNILLNKNIIITYKIPSMVEISKRRIKNIFFNARKNIKEDDADVLLPQKIQIPKLKPAKIINKIYNEKYDYTKYTLSNKVNFYYKYNNYDKNIVLLTSYSKGGYSLYDTKNLTNAQLATNIIINSGLDKYNIIDVSKIYSDKSVSVNLNINRYSETISGSSFSDDFEFLLEKIYLATTRYRFDDNVLSNTKSIILANLKEEKRNPNIRYNRDFLDFYYKGNKRYTKATKDDILNLNKNEILKIYKDRFSDLNNFIFFIVGDIQQEEVEKFAKIYLGNLPTKDRNETYNFRGLEYIKGKNNFIRNYSNENISKITLSYKKQIAYHESYSIRLSALGDILNNKLREFIREEKSGTYNILVQTNMTREPYSSSTITISYSCDPKRKDEILTYVKNIINNLKTTNVDNSYINSYVKSKILAIDKNIKTPSFWLNMLKLTTRYSESLDKIEEIKNEIKNLNSDKIKEAANIFFDTNDIIYTQLNPKEM